MTTLHVLGATQDLPLPVCAWIDGISLVGGLGVEDQTKGLRQVSILLHFFFRFVVVNKEAYRQKQEDVMNWNKKFYKHLLLDLSNS
jgi:hypothetical protein